MASGAVRYKFKSANAFDTLTFDGSFIAVGELRRAISEKKGLGRDLACELVLANAQDGTEYGDDSALVWKNTSVIVKRVPAMRQAAVGTAQGSAVVKKVVYVAPPDTSMIPSKSVNRRLQMNLNKIANEREGGGGADGDDALANMAREQAQRWESEKMAANAASGGRGGRGGGRGIGRRGDGPPGPGYICFKCNKGGHWIQDCPLAADTTVEIVRTKHAYGIPQTKLEAATGGILVAPTGESAQMVAAEDEFQKMFGFLQERGKETLALGNGESETLALGNGEDAAHEDAKPEPEPPAPVLPPGFVPPMPMGPPPPGAQKRELAPPPGPSMEMNMDLLDPMGIMSMDTSLEGLKKMAEELKKQQDLLDESRLSVLGVRAPARPPPPVMPPPPAMPPPPPMPRAAPTGPPVFEEDEDTVVMLAGEEEEQEPVVTEDENALRGRAPPPPPARRPAPPPPPSVIPDDIAKAHEEQMRAQENGRKREDAREPGPRFGTGMKPPPQRRGRVDSREPPSRRRRSRDAAPKRGRESPTEDEPSAKKQNDGSGTFSHENSADDLSADPSGARPRRSRGGRGRSRGGRNRGPGSGGKSDILSRIG